MAETDRVGGDRGGLYKIYAGPHPVDYGVSTQVGSLDCSPRVSRSSVELHCGYPEGWLQRVPQWTVDLAGSRQFALPTRYLDTQRGDQGSELVSDYHWPEEQRVGV